MGGLVGGIYDLFGGDPTAGEEKQLGSLGTFDTGVGEGLTAAGANFEREILSGNPTEIATALAPEISTEAGQVEQQRLQGSEFGTRSGGTAAATNAAESKSRGDIINLEGGLQANTAGAAVGQGTGLLGQASSDISKKAELDAQNRQRTVGDVSGIASDVASIATPFLGGAGVPAAASEQFQAPQLTSFGPNEGLAPAPFSQQDLEGLEQAPDLSIFQ